MTQEEKDLLLKDLCARLPYGVKVESVFINPNTKEHKSCGIEVFDATSILMIRDGLGEFKPYLLPLSSMNEEQKKEYCSLVWFDGLSAGWNRDDAVVLNEVEILIDFYHKNHLDWRGLIEKGLALDATNKNIY